MPRSTGSTRSFVTARTCSSHTPRGRSRVAPLDSGRVREGRESTCGTCAGRVRPGVHPRAGASGGQRGQHRHPGRAVRRDRRPRPGECLGAGRGAGVRRAPRAGVVPGRVRVRVPRHRPPGPLPARPRHGHRSCWTSRTRSTWVADSCSPPPPGRTPWSTPTRSPTPQSAPSASATRWSWTPCAPPPHRTPRCSSTTCCPQVPGLVEALDEGGAILEIGCGAGQLCLALARRFPTARLVGVEFDPRQRRAGPLRRAGRRPCSTESR